MTFVFEGLVTASLTLAGIYLVLSLYIARVIINLQRASKTPDITTRKLFVMNLLMTSFLRFLVSGLTTQLSVVALLSSGFSVRTSRLLSLPVGIIYMHTLYVLYHMCAVVYIDDYIGLRRDTLCRAIGQRHSAGHRRPDDHHDRGKLASTLAEELAPYPTSEGRPASLTPTFVFTITHILFISVFVARVTLSACNLPSPLSPGLTENVNCCHRCSSKRRRWYYSTFQIFAASVHTFFSWLYGRSHTCW
jgi:hypothetical protein